MSSLVHPTAVIDRHAELGPGVEVGPYCVVGPGVRIDEGTRLLAHVVVDGRTAIGRRNVIHAFTVLGGPPQLRKEGEPPSRPGAIKTPGRLEIGDDNVIREHVTVNVASGDVPTTIGSKNLVMAGAHLAHDVRVGSFCVIANGVQLAGHVIVEDWVTFGGLSGVAQRLRVGEGAFVAGGAMCEREVPPFVIVQGDRARVRALNIVGLQRRGIPAASIAALEHAFASVFVSKRSGFDRAVADLDRGDPFVAKLADALARSVQ